MSEGKKTLRCQKSGCKQQVSVDATVQGKLVHPATGNDEHYVLLDAPA